MADLTAQNKWEPLATDNSDREKIWSKSRTFAGDVWFRFRRKPTAIAGFVIIIALMLFALVGPLFTPYDYSVQNLEVVNVPPVMKVYQIPNGDYLYITTALKVISVTPDGKLGGQLRKVRDESDKSMTIFDADGTEVALYYGGTNGYGERDAVLSWMEGLDDRRFSVLRCDWANRRNDPPMPVFIWKER